MHVVDLVAHKATRQTQLKTKRVYLPDRAGASNSNFSAHGIPSLDSAAALLVLLVPARLLLLSLVLSPVVRGTHDCAMQSSAAVADVGATGVEFEAMA